MIFAIFLLFFQLSNPNINAQTSDPRIKSHKFYKLGFKEYKIKKYTDAIEYIEKALIIFPRHKKAKELLQELRNKGQEFYNTGIALVYFNKTMSLDYLNQANRLLAPKDLRRKKITRIIKRLEHNEAVQDQDMDQKDS